jgi:hypothetical protein
MRILALVGLVLGSLFTFVGAGDLWLVSRLRDPGIDAVASAQNAFVVWLVAGAFYFSLGVVLLVISLAVRRSLSWATKAWLATTTALSATVAITHYRFHLGGLWEWLVIALLAATSWFLFLRTATEAQPSSPTKV